jgi:hypothetical protein
VTEYEIMTRVLSQLKLDKSRPPIWEPYYYDGSDFRDGWTCSCCGKHSLLKKEICDGCDSIMNNVEHGEWIENPKVCHSPYCSLCGAIGNKSSYCPHCGAKMDGGKTE